MSFKIGDHVVRYSDLLQGWQVGTIKAMYVGELAVTDVMLLCDKANPRNSTDEPHVIDMGAAVWPIGQAWKV